MSAGLKLKTSRTAASIFSSGICPVPKVSTQTGATLVEVAASDAAERPLAGLQATARLLHPTDTRADQLVVLTEQSAGQFQGRSAPLVGQWMLVVELSRDGARLFRSKNRVFLR